MQNYKLKDNKGVEVKILCQYSDIVHGEQLHIIAGENGSIRVNDMYLQPMTNGDGFLCDIVDVRSDDRGKIAALCNDNILYIYEGHEKYKPIKINLKTNQDIARDSLHSILYYNREAIVITGDLNIKYLIQVVRN